MFKIDTNQARTDLSGIGKGEAQIIDLSPTFQRQRQQEQINAQKDAVAQREKRDADNKRYTDIAGLKSIAIRPADRDIFASKQKDVTDYVYKNARALHEGDPKAMMEYQNLFADLYTSAENSKNYREVEDKLLLEIAKNGEAAFDSDDVENIKVGYNTPNDGKYNAGTLGLSKAFNFDSYLKKTGKDLAEQVKQGKSTYEDINGVTYTHETDQTDKQFADAVLKSQVHNDPLLQSWASKQFNKLPKEEQEKFIGENTNKVDAISDFILNKVSTEYPTPSDKKGNTLYSENKNPLVFNKTDTGTIRANGSGNGSGRSTQVPMSGTLTKDTEGRDVLSFDTDKTTDNPDIKFVVNGKTITGKPQRIIYNKDENTAPELVVFVTPNKEQGIDGGEVKVGWTEAQRTMSEKYGMDNVYKVLHGNEPDNWKISRPQQGKAEVAKSPYTKAQEDNINIVLNNPKNKGITREKAIAALKY